MELLKKVKTAWDEFATIGASTHASSIAYYTFFSLVPLLALCVSIFTLVGVDERQVHEVIMAIVPEALEDLVASLVADAFERSGLAISLSTLSLLWSASKGAKALRAGLNAAYGERETRNAVEVAVISIAAVVTMGVLIAAATWLVFGSSILHILSQHIRGLEANKAFLGLVDVAITLGAGVFGVALCYTRLPAGKRSFVAQMPGAACALVGCGILSFGYRVYVDNIANSAALYGSLATVALLLLWMYLMFYIVIAGGFINRWLQERAA